MRLATRRLATPLATPVLQPPLVTGMLLEAGRVAAGVLLAASRWDWIVRRHLRGRGVCVCVCVWLQ